jgi:hypothetical protein
MNVRFAVWIQPIDATPRLSTWSGGVAYEVPDEDLLH